MNQPLPPPDLFWLNLTRTSDLKDRAREDEGVGREKGAERAFSYCFGCSYRLCILISSSADLSNRIVLPFGFQCAHPIRALLGDQTFPVNDTYSYFFVKHGNTHVYPYFRCVFSKKEGVYTACEINYQHQRPWLNEKIE